MYIYHYLEKMINNNYFFNDSIILENAKTEFFEQDCNDTKKQPHAGIATGYRTFISDAARGGEKHGSVCIYKKEA